MTITKQEERFIEFLDEILSLENSIVYVNNGSYIDICRFTSYGLKDYGTDIKITLNMVLRGLDNCFENCFGTYYKAGYYFKIVTNGNVLLKNEIRKILSEKHNEMIDLFIK